MIDIVYEDEHFLAVNKVPELLSVPGKTDLPDLHTLVRQEYPDAQIVHRLDMSTSGIILFAQTKACQAALGKLFEQRKVAKRYRAVVDGIIQEDSGEIVLPLLCDWPNRPKQHVNWQHGKPAHTRFEVIHRNESSKSSEIFLYPITGRSHQLRVHCLELGHPILGDNLYAHESARARASRLLLHAEFLKFDHPFTSEEIEIFVPADF